MRERVISEEFDEKDFNSWINTLILDYFVISLLLITFWAHYYGDLNYSILMVVLVCNDIRNLMGNVINIRHNKSQKRRNRVCLLCFENTIMLFFKVMLKIYIDDKSFNAVYCVIPLFIYTIFRIFLYHCIKLTDCISLIDFATLLFRLFLTIQTLLICFKIENALVWSWGQVFWCFWIFFAFIAGINFGLILLFLNKLCEKESNIEHKHEVKGIFWILFINTNFTILSCFFIINLIKYFDNNDGSRIMEFLYFIIASFFGILIITFYCRKSIIVFFRIVNASYQFIDNNRPEINQDSISHSQKKSDSSFIIPHFLLKFSSTYFKRSSIKEIIDNKTKFQLKKSSSLTEIGRIAKNTEYNDLLKQKPIYKNQIFTSNENYLTTIENSQTTHPTHTDREKKLKSDNVEIIIFDDESQRNQKGYNEINNKNDKNSPLITDKFRSLQLISNDIMEKSIISVDKSVNNCLICFDKSPDAVIMECGHGGICYDCSLELWKSTGECYLCRKIIKQILQIDLKTKKEGDIIKVLSSTQKEEIIE